MKKSILSAISLLFAMITVNGQEDVATNYNNISYGVKAGYNSFIVRASFEGNSASVDESGFYFGIFAEFEVSEKFNIQPELQYVIVTGDGDNGNLLVLPIIGKYKASEKFSLMAGPQLDYILDDDTEGLKKLGIGLATGLAFDVSDNFFLDMRYAFGLSNRLDEPEEDFGDDGLKVKFSYVQVGIGYRF